MIVKLWMDLPTEYFVKPEDVLAMGDKNSVKMHNHTRYLIEVDLPVHHFKPQADRVIKAVVIGKEEE